MRADSVCVHKPLWIPPGWRMWKFDRLCWYLHCVSHGIIRSHYHILRSYRSVIHVLSNFRINKRQKNNSAVGIAFGMLYTAATISVGYYFERYRALATGIASCGSSFGGLCMSPLFAYITNTKSWDFTMRIQSILMFVSLVGAMTMRPLKPTTKVPLTPDIFDEIV